VKRIKKLREKERQRNRKIVREDGEPEKKGRDRIKY